ncbi:MAG: hypothetical protein IIA87_05185 [Nanoarchaeota archaeon]|nr:hypothetical protein [Nanoarchaeota archaeon]
MVQVVDVPRDDSYRSERVKRLEEIAKKTLGPSGVPINVRGQHLEIGLAAATIVMDVYFDKNEIDVYASNWVNIGQRVASAFEEAGEGKFTVRRNYVSERSVAS